MEKEIELEVMKHKLDKQQEELSVRVKVEREKAAPSSLANPDRADLARDYTNRARRLSMLEKSEEQLKEIEQALQRIENGTYGQCTQCGEYIRPERLGALPSAPLCIHCQRKESAN